MIKSEATKAMLLLGCDKDHKHKPNVATLSKKIPVPVSAIVRLLAAVGLVNLRPGSHHAVHDALRAGRRVACMLGVAFGAAVAVAVAVVA